MYLKRKKDKKKKKVKKYLKKDGKHKEQKTHMVLIYFRPSIECVYLNKSPSYANIEYCLTPFSSLYFNTSSVLLRC